MNNGREDDPLLTRIAELGAEAKSTRRHAADALAALAHRDSRVVPVLRSQLNNGDPRARWGAAYALGLIGGHAFGIDALAPLLAALGDDDGDMRWAAAELIVRLGGANRGAVRDALIRTADDGAAAARKMALYCLRDLRVKDDSMFALVEHGASASDPHLRLAALSMLWNLGDSSDKAAAIAIRCLENDADAGVRRAAAIALGRLKNRSPDSISALRRAAENRGDDSLARAARIALERLEK